MLPNNTPVTTAARKRVALRAGYGCEYCLAQDLSSFIGFEIDHIISRKHRGSNDDDNLVYPCPACNRNKGPDIASIDWDNQRVITRFFNPRTDIWSEHFKLSGSFIEPLTAIGKVTVVIFLFNDRIRLPDRGIF